MLPAGRWLCVTGGSWARLCWDRSATTKQLGLFPLGWHLGSSPPCPVPTFPFSLHSVHATGAAWGPSGEAGCGCCPIFGMFSSLFPSHSWCLSCVMEPFICLRAPCSTVPPMGLPSPRGGSRMVPRHITGAAGVLLPKGEEKPKLPEGEIQLGQGNPNPQRDGTGQGPERSHQPRWLTAQVNSDTDPN